MIYYILFLVSGFIIGFFIKTGQVEIRKQIAASKSEIELLLEEIESCGEINEAITYRCPHCRGLLLTNETLLYSGCAYNPNSTEWYHTPHIKIKGLKLELSKNQEIKVHELINTKLAESGRTQITNLLTE